MSTLSRILRHVALGRLLLLCLLIAPPTACTTGSDLDDSTPVRRTTERGPVELTVTVTSEQIEVGSPLTVELLATAQADTTVTTPLVTIADGELLGGFHVLANEDRPDYPGPDGKRVWSQTLTLDTFTPGTLELPAFNVSFADRRGDVTIDGQIASDPWTITIISALGDASANAALRDIRGHVGVPTSDWIIWSSVGSGILLVVIGLVARRLGRRHNATIDPPLPPHELARLQLDRLEADGLLEQRSFQSFYFRLSDILRHYIEGRFGMLAPTKTTPEFLMDLKTCAIFEQDQQMNLSHFLRCSDMVKFALHEPPIDEGREAMQLARVFVDDTEPISEPLEAAN